MVVSKWTRVRNDGKMEHAEVVDSAAREGPGFVAWNVDSGRFAAHNGDGHRFETVAEIEVVLEDNGWERDK